MEVFRRLVLEQQPPPARFQASEMCIRLLEELPPPASMETDKGAQGPGKSRQTKNVTAAAKRKHLPDGAAPDAKRSKRICEFKTTGTCDIPNCRAPHLASMMKPGSNTASVVCKFYRSGACTVEDCGFAHDLSLEACVYFHFRGGCKNSACPFSHDPLTDFQRAQYDKNCASFQEKEEKRREANLLAVSLPVYENEPEEPLSFELTEEELPVREGKEASDRGNVDILAQPFGAAGPFKLPDPEENLL
ncbi:MAG: hypothetical protein SGCHY_003581 [Lobulomycetales sp.]